MKKFILILFFIFSGATYAYDACQAYDPSSNPNPSLPCSYNGYDYDSLAVEAGVNSLFYKGEKYVLTDYDWWWSLTSPEYVTQDGILYAWGGWHPEFHSLSFAKDGALFFGSGASYIPPQLTVVIEPAGVLPGSVVSVPSGVISCGADPEVCSAPMSQAASISLEAVPNTGWVFGHWEEAGSPYVLTLNTSLNKAVTARFYRTFRNAVGNFYQNSGDGGECVDYVNAELGIAFTGHAWTWFQEAIAKHYYVDMNPTIGSIVVFAPVPNTALQYGHVGIVTSVNGNMISIRDSNWCSNNCHSIDDHAENLGPGGYKVLGYIHYTP